MLKKYSELTEEEKKQVSLMYSDQVTLSQFLYNFDDKGKYHGRQYAPPSGKDDKAGVFGTIHAESIVPSGKDDEMGAPGVIYDYFKDKEEAKAKEEEKEPEKLVKTQPVKQTRRTAKKK